jgi:hypothetical protein
LSWPLGLLCARRERPRRRATEQRDEDAPRHSITSSTATSSVGGTSIANAFRCSGCASPQREPTSWPARVIASCQANFTGD